LPSFPRISPSSTPSRSSRTTIRAQPRILGQRNSAGSESGSIYPGLICRCQGICSSCHLLRQPPTPGSRSGMMNTIGLTEPHVSNDLYDARVDPRSPIRRGTAQPGR
jgi:hypothetical protein